MCTFHLQQYQSTISQIFTSIHIHMSTLIHTQHKASCIASGTSFFPSQLLTICKDLCSCMANTYHVWGFQSYSCCGQRSHRLFIRPLVPLLLLIQLLKLTLKLLAFLSYLQNLQTLCPHYSFGFTALIFLPKFTNILSKALIQELSSSYIPS